VTVAVAIDLGSSRIKAARMQADSRLTNPIAADAPPLSGEAGVRQGSAKAYLAAAEAGLQLGLLTPLLVLVVNWVWGVVTALTIKYAR
jgi:hypothetical protein